MSISWERDFRYRVGSFHFDWSIGTLVLRLFFKAWGETGQHDGTTTVPSTFWCKLHVDLLTACVSASAWLTSMSMYSPTTMYTNCSAAAVVRVQYAGMLRSVDCVYNGSKVRRSYSLEALATRLLQRAYQSFLSGFSVRYDGTCNQAVICRQADVLTNSFSGMSSSGCTPLNHDDLYQAYPTLLT
jgi:hypothetical protein